VIHEAQIFVGALGASQYTFAEATASQQLSDWIQSHVRMFEFFGGVSSIVVPDNLKSGVKKSHLYDPDINPNYQNFGEYYGVAIVPARVREPKDKAKVENAVGCVERQVLAPLRHRTFTSLYEINVAIKELLAQFNKKPMQKMKISRFELYETLDKPALKILPSESYEYVEWANAKVNIDYHFVFQNHYYSVPYKYIHQQVEIRASLKTVECLYQGNRIASHIRSLEKYKYTTQKVHMPESHRAHAEWTPDRMRRWAKKIGPKTAEFIEHMISSRAFPEQAFRACLGVLRLGKKYGEGRLEKACAKGIDAGATRYQQIESILINKVEDLPLFKAAIPSPIPRHDNIRGSEYYQ
jgi:transposase